MNIIKSQIPIINRYLNLSEASDTSVGNCIKKSGITGYEPETLSAAISLVETYNINSFADIGANIGIYSLVLKAVSHKLRVDAFEPLAKLSNILTELSRKNNLPIRIFHDALSNKRGQATFYVSAKSDTSNSLNKNFRPAKDKIQVSIDTLDDLMRDQNIDYQLLKIDTESTEPDVLSGAKILIAKNRPWIICEILAGRTEAEIMENMKPFNYKFYHLSGPPLTESKIVTGDRTYVNRDWLFAPEVLSENFQRSYKRWYEAFTNTVA